MTELQRSLFELQDLKYRDFQSKLLPKTEKEKIIGVRTPILRKFAKEFAQTKEAQNFLQELPHQYYEENNLHLMLVTQICDYKKCLILIIGQPVIYPYQNALKNTKRN